MSVGPAQPQYRPDIDGLRALAVFLVLFDHLRVSRFSGGYVGVDVFFVISGFLITRLIVQEVREGRGFSFSRFYARRLRRILPALLATCIVSAVFAFLLLSPEDLAAFGGSLWTSVLSMSNVFFCFNTGYFAAEAQTRPLLHLWSLGVEEQFYALWPLLLVLLMKRGERVTVWSLVGAGVVSVLLAQWFLLNRSWFADANDPAFYLTPFRVFEFAMGGLMVWGVAVRPARSIVMELLLVAGLGLIVGSAVTYSPATTFPGLCALVPCTGAALVIYAGTAQHAGWLLRNRLAVGLGLISYSIYLLHWPLIVMVGYYRYAPLTLAGKVVLLGVVLGSAAAMYHWVEQPFRRRPFDRSARRPLVAAVVTMVMLVAAGASAWAQRGWEWRLPASRQGPTPQEWLARERAYCEPGRRTVPHELAPCQHNGSSRRMIAAWGDSHAQHLIAGLSEAYPDYNVLVFYRPGCTAASGFLGYEGQLNDRIAEAECVEYNRRTLEFLIRHPPMTILLSNAKRDTPALVAPATAFLASRLRAAGHRVVLLGDFIGPGRPGVSCRSVPAWLIPDSALITRCSGDRAELQRQWQYSDDLIARLPETVDVRPVQCPGGVCAFASDDGTPFFRDSDHLTTAGAIRFIALLKDRLRIRP
jgi:peptidoglycan/LPS O-acetylase OafA/YrhL